MAYTINRRLAQLVDGNGQLNTGKIPNDYITSDHVADNTITAAMLHTSFTVSTSNLTAIDTDDVSEGSTNLYYTDARVDTEINSYLSGGTGVTYSSGAISIGQDVGTSATPTFGNITTTGYIAGPATFTIDPAAVGDNTGTVVIAGNLQVDGTTTTINSTTMTVDDLNLTLASGAANAAAANGAGITVDGASATIIYDGTNDEWDFNKDINVTGTATINTTSLTGIAIDSTNNGSQISFESAVSSVPWYVGVSGDSTEDFVVYQSGTGSGAVRLYTDGDTRLNIANNGDISFYEDTGSTAKFFWDASAESLGIGTSSPDTLLNIASSSAPTLRIENTDSTLGLGQVIGAVEFYKTDTSGAGAGVAGGMQLLSTFSTGSKTALAFSTSNASGNNVEGFRLDEDGNVGINQTSPSTLLHVGDGTDADRGIITIEGAGGEHLIFSESSTHPYGANAFAIRPASGTNFIIQNDGASTPAVLVDTSGNLLVGGTSTTLYADSSGTGMVYRDDFGILGVTSTGIQPLILNRTGSDGIISEFRKDGSPVGSIGTSGGLLNIGSGDIGLLFIPSTDVIIPSNPTDTANGGKDAAIDLGNIYNRFKDLYLSGGVHLGGTGSANKLDDYEEGTWTPVVNGLTTAGVFTYSVQEGKYTKVGNLVAISCAIRVTGTSTSPVGDIRITGLPFTIGNQFPSFAVGWSQYITFADQLGGYGGATQITLRNMLSGGSGSNLQASAFGNAFYIFLSGTYQV